MNISKFNITDVKKIKSRYQSIPEFCKNKVVLSIGCVDMIEVYPLKERINSGKHQFYNLNRTAKRAIGIDINDSGIQQLRQIGLEAYQYDIFSNEKLEIQDINFGVILLSHVLEHIPNYYEFLENVIKKFKFKNIIICLPNAYHNCGILSKVFSDNQEIISNDHYYTFTSYGLLNIMDSLCIKKWTFFKIFGL